MHDEITQVLPDLVDRNFAQYWIWQNKESVIKSRNVWYDLEVDQAFNLTSTYRLDSDIPRQFGTIRRTLVNIYTRGNATVPSPKKHLQDLLGKRSKCFGLKHVMS